MAERYNNSSVRINYTYQVPECATGDVIIVDEYGRKWKRDYEPGYETTGVTKGIREGNTIKVQYGNKGNK